MALKEPVDILGNSCRKAVVGCVIGRVPYLLRALSQGRRFPGRCRALLRWCRVWAPIHTSATAGGIAANLQMLNIGLLTSGAMTTGATVGACLRTVKPVKTTRSVITNYHSLDQERQVRGSTTFVKHVIRGDTQNPNAHETD